jgi:hypothetical protein
MTHRSKSSWLGEVEPDFDRLLRRQGSNLRLAINSRASYLLDHTGTKAEGEGVEPPRPEPTRFRDGIPRQVAVLPISDPDRSRTCMWPIKSRLLCRLSYGAQERSDDASGADAGFAGVGRSRVASKREAERSRHGSAPAEPDFARRCGREDSNLQRPAFQAGALPAWSYDHADGRGWGRTSGLLFVRQAL